MPVGRSSSSSSSSPSVLRGRRTHVHAHARRVCPRPVTPARLLSPQEAAVSEEVELIVESLLGVLLRTILEISNRPQPAGPPMRLQVQDVTVRVLHTEPAKTVLGFSVKSNYRFLSRRRRRH